MVWVKTHAGVATVMPPRSRTADQRSHWTTLRTEKIASPATMSTHPTTRCGGFNGKSSRTLTQATSAQASAAARPVLVIAWSSRQVPRSALRASSAPSRCVETPGESVAPCTAADRAVAFWPTPEPVSATHSRVAPRRNERASIRVNPLASRSASNSGPEPNSKMLCDR
jgi:hypothetical protein